MPRLLGGRFSCQANALKHELMRHDRTAPDEIGTDLDLTRPVLDDFGEHLGEQLNALALRMISRGMFPSDGYSVAFMFDKSGAVLRYAFFPVDCRGRPVLIDSASGGGQQNPATTP